MIVADLIHHLSQLNPDALVCLSTQDPLKGYHIEIAVTKFGAHTDDIVVIRPDSPYTQIPYNVIEAGWRPTR